MGKLENKIFLVIFSILTIFLVSILCIFNFQDYNHEKSDIENNLTRMKDNREFMDLQRPQINEEMSENQIRERPIFMDIVAYIVTYDENKEIVNIENYSKENVPDEEIKEVAENILATNNEKTTKIGNLYLEKYSYTFKENNVLCIIDNTSTQSKLFSLLRTSIIIFILLEIIIVIISIKLTRWIIKPVVDSFNKQKQFIADASHELKTPIAVIMANAEALENEPQEKKWLNNIKSESERMNELVSDLLDLAKLENGANKEEFINTDLSKLVESSTLTFESLIYENKIELKYDIQKEITMSCNSSQIKQLVAILIDNAIKHSQENGKIVITLKKEKNEAILQVSNKGKEIPREKLDKIFERFYRVDEARNRDSNRYGLGLAIAKNIVENHNGQILVESKDGITTFIVKFKR